MEYAVYAGLCVYLLVASWSIWGRFRSKPAPPHRCCHGGTTVGAVLLCDCGSRVVVATAAGTYELGHTVHQLPAVRNLETGRTWILPWGELVHLARECGIDRPVAPKGGQPCPTRA